MGLMMRFSLMCLMCIFLSCVKCCSRLGWGWRFM